MAPSIINIVRRNGQLSAELGASTRRSLRRTLALLREINQSSGDWPLATSAADAAKAICEVLNVGAIAPTTKHAGRSRGSSGKDMGLPVGDR